MLEEVESLHSTSLCVEGEGDFSKKKTRGKLRKHLSRKKPQKRAGRGGRWSEISEHETPSRKSTH